MTSPTDKSPSTLAIRFATPADVSTILHFIHALARYEKLEHEVVADEAGLLATLFAPRPAAEVLLADLAGSAVGFALFFQSYSTWLARPGLYLEDLFVEPAARGQGVGLALMSALARITVARGYGRFEWSVLADWEPRLRRTPRRAGRRAESEVTVQRLTGASLAALAERWPGTRLLTTARRGMASRRCRGPASTDAHDCLAPQPTVSRYCRAPRPS
jgi:GNAT superfamily N-acetyltransferase